MTPPTFQRPKPAHMAGSKQALYLSTLFIGRLTTLKESMLKYGFRERQQHIFYRQVSLGIYARLSTV